MNGKLDIDDLGNKNGNWFQLPYSLIERCIIIFCPDQTDLKKASDLLLLCVFADCLYCYCSVFGTSPHWFNLTRTTNS